MKIFIFFTIILLSNSCGIKPIKDNPELRLILDPNNVNQILLFCAGDTLDFNTAELIDKINTAKPIGFTKGIVRKNLCIILNNGDTLNLRLFNNQFKWDKSGDWTYKMDYTENYFESACDKKVL